MATVESADDRKLVSFRIPPGLHKAARKAAIDDGMPVQEWYEHAIADHLRRRDAANQANPPAN